MRLADIIKQYRKANDLTQGDLAEACGLHFSHISRIEKGFIPPRNTVKRVARAMGMDEDRLLLSAGYLPKSMIDRNLGEALTDEKVQAIALKAGTELSDAGREFLLKMIEHAKTITSEGDKQRA
ncbi:MAG: helix-turn-helix transcriptional regulator [Firmicutes bacterium]|nr:helix-turn-helix transcriptional regulator [Bacillota bacterium]